MKLARIKAVSSKPKSMSCAAGSVFFIKRLLAKNHRAKRSVLPQVGQDADRRRAAPAKGAAPKNP